MTALSRLWRYLTQSPVIGSTVPRWNAVLADRAAAATERLLLGACGPARPARDAEAIAAREARLRALAPPVDIGALKAHSTRGLCPSGRYARAAPVVRH